MRKTLLTTILLTIVAFGFPQKQWKKSGVKPPPVKRYASGEVSRTYVAPPYELLNRSKSTAGKRSEIIVTYDASFEADAAAKNAFQFAVDIWEQLIYSPVPIHLLANWDELDENVLGQCGPTKMYLNFETVPFKGVWYSVALAEKMLGEEILVGSDNPDMEATFNKNFDWYFGTDGNCPPNKQDFVSTVMHELCHGLGFIGSFYEDGGKAGYQSDAESPSSIFDKYIINGSGDFLTDKSLFDDPSVELLEQVTSGNLRFKSEIAYEDGGLSQYPKLYAPPEWDPGSSVYHLDEFTYFSGTVNSMMTPAGSDGEAVHDPGPLALGIMYEMGWKFIYMDHEELSDIENLEDMQPAEVYVESDYELDSTQLYLVYSTDEFENSDSVLLTATVEANYFSADLPLTEEGTVEYYFSATDVRERTFRLPGIAPERNYSITFGEDTIAPTLSHEPVAWMRPDDLSETFVASASDNIGIDSVKVEYIVNNQEAQELVLELDTLDIYKGLLEFEAGSLLEGDSIQYRVIVKDRSANENSTQLPGKGYYTFYIESAAEPVEEYFTDFNSANRDFISSSFTIQALTGFDDGALHSIHPYESPGDDDSSTEFSYEYKAQLKYPVIIKNGGTIAYDEVVLVEPGESGTTYGDEQFWDYVIVEGSKDDGETWLPLIDGYDSADRSTWLSAYNGSMSGRNSSAVGTKNMYVNRRFGINGKGNFETGDTIMIQFRIFSDELSNGWGWCIDNLSIQDPETAVAGVDFSPGEVLFYPNPVEDRVVFHGTFDEYVGQLKLTLFSAFGQAVLQKQIGVNGNDVHETIDVSGLTSGIYFVSIGFENGQRISRKIMKK